MKANYLGGTAVLGTVAVLAGLWTIPGTAGGHATVTPIQPQTTPLTAARTTYVLRVPNEKDAQSTYKVTLFVPGPLQEAITVRQTHDWSVRLRRRDTGKTNAEGGKVYAITSISWIAKRGGEIRPHFFGEFILRWQNPVQPGRFCFPVNQYYRPPGFSKLSRARKRRAKPERVAWTGPSDAEFPASCVTTVAGSPAAH